VKYQETDGQRYHNWRWVEIMVGDDAKGFWQNVERNHTQNHASRKTKQVVNMFAMLNTD
jgi:hypothetical protein